MIWIKPLLCFLLAANRLSRSLGTVLPMEYLPPDLQGYLDTCHSTGDLSQQNARLVFWTAINQYTSKFVRNRPDLTRQQTSFLTRNIQDALAPLFRMPLPRGRKKRQALGPRIRREIRALTDAERARYFAAVNALKTDRRLPPNIYDFLAAYHQGENVQRAHFGPAFPSWHRLYLWIFEYFLRLVNPTVTVPYWASVMDNDMEDATTSVLWTPAFFGNGDGDIRTGPFRNWPQINATTVFQRNVQDADLFTVDGINSILSRSRNSEILIPTALADSNFEIQHGAGHVFVGGTMNNLNAAARDPVFFSHHAFVDQIWERFRQNQIRRGIDPQSDYPFDANDARFRASHNPTATAGFQGLSGAQTWTQNLGYLNAFSDFVRYEEVPTCPLCANSAYLFCDQTLNRCVSRTADELAGTGLLVAPPATTTRKKRTPRNYRTDVCQRRNFLHDIDTRMSGLSSGLTLAQSSEWIFIPVKIVAKRPSEYSRFSRYSLYNKATNVQQGLNMEFVKPGVQKRYESCDKLQATLGKIIIVSHGLSYDGYAEEYVLLDNRLGVSEGNGFIPVKKPTAANPSEVIIAAFDSCGRVCKPYCRSGGLDRMVGDQHFSGGIRVSTASPLQYANSYANAMLDIWDIPSTSSCPRLDNDRVPVSFFCKYTDTWIWDSPTTAGGMRGQRRVMTGPGPQDGPQVGPSHGVGRLNEGTLPRGVGLRRSGVPPHRPVIIRSLTRVSAAPTSRSEQVLCRYTSARNSYNCSPRVPFRGSATLTQFVPTGLYQDRRHQG